MAATMPNEKTNARMLETRYLPALISLNGKAMTTLAKKADRTKHQDQTTGFSGHHHQSGQGGTSAAAINVPTRAMATRTPPPHLKNFESWNFFSSSAPHLTYFSFSAQSGDTTRKKPMTPTARPRNAPHMIPFWGHQESSDPWMNGRVASDIAIQVPTRAGTTSNTATQSMTYFHL